MRYGADIFAQLERLYIFSVWKFCVFQLAQLYTQRISVIQHPLHTFNSFRSKTRLVPAATPAA